MKKKIAFLVSICLFLGAGLSQISAQKTFQGWAPSVPWSLEVYCDGESTDYVEGVVKIHWVFHSDDEEPWQILQIKGTVTSTKTGEVFKLKEMDKKDFFPSPWVVTYHYNLKGNMGNHYIGTATVNISVWPYVFTPIRTVCN